MNKSEQYLKEQEATGIKMGDYVQVLFKVPSYVKGWSASWNEEMNKYIGKTHKVTRVGTMNVGFLLEYQGQSFWFPYFCMEKVETPPPKPISLPGTGLTALVSPHDIKVGCQTFTLGQLKDLVSVIESVSKFKLNTLNVKVDALNVEERVIQVSVIKQIISIAENL